MLETQHTTEAKYKKWEKEPVPHAWDDMRLFLLTCLIGKWCYLISLIY
jgi:hypothetical protein